MQLKDIYFLLATYAIGSKYSILVKETAGPLHSLLRINTLSVLATRIYTAKSVIECHGALFFNPSSLVEVNSSWHSNRG